MKLLLRRELENKNNWRGNNKDQKTAEIIQQKLVKMVATLDKIEAKYKKQAQNEIVSHKLWLKVDGKF